MDSNDTLLTCLAKKKNISIIVPIQLLHHPNDLLEEMNSPPFYVHDWILHTMDENHLMNFLIINSSMIQEDYTIFYYPIFNHTF